MNTEQRIQVREMLHDILAGYQAKNESAIDITNAQLKGINNRLDKLNGTVAENSKNIKDNLPRTTANCPQAENIEELKINMISGKVIKKAVITGITISGTLFIIGSILYNVISNLTQ